MNHDNNLKWLFDEKKVQDFQCQRFFLYSPRLTTSTTCYLIQQICGCGVREPKKLLIQERFFVNLMNKI
jgi:hypothetical protein